MNESAVKAPLEDIRALARSAPDPDHEAVAAVRARDAVLTKPAGSLGLLEDIVEWLAAWQRRAPPKVEMPRVAVFAGNHGITARGVSAFPAEVTHQMVANFTNGGAAINQMCAAMDISDGLVKDFNRLCRASGVGGIIEAARVPISSHARTVIDGGGATLVDLLTGGEDYEVLAAIRPDLAEEFENQAKAARTQVTRIGSIAHADEGITVIDEAGRPMHIAKTGWDHFR